MRKFYVFILAILLFVDRSGAQVTYTWAGGASGDYQVAANWTPVRSTILTNDILAFNATSAIVVSNVPNQAIGALKIASGTSTVSFATNSSTNVLTLNAATPLIYNTAGSILAADLLTVRLNNPGAFAMSLGTFGIAAGTGGKIFINSALTLSGGKLDFDVAGTGGTIIAGSITYTTGIFNCINPSALTWAGTASYYHNFGGSGASAIPAAVWQTNSTCNITGMNTGTTAPTGLTSIDFANFTWNCSAQYGDVDLNLTAANFQGTFYVSNTNNKNVRLAGAAGGSITVGSYTQTGGNVVLQTSSGTTTLVVSGAFSQTGGILDGVTGSSAGTAILDFKKAVTKSATWQCSGSNAGAQMNIQFSGSVAQTVSLSGTWTNTAGRTNATITNTNTVTGVTLTIGSILKVIGNATLAATCSLSGLLNQADASAYVSYVGNGTLLYSGSIGQLATVVEFPASGGPTNLAISNTIGVVFPVGSFNRTLTGVLSMVNGNLAMTGDTLSLTNAAVASQLSYTAGFITSGTLGRKLPASGLPVSSASSVRFPMGSGVNDRSLNMFFSTSNLSSGGSAGMVYVTHTPVSGVTPISPTYNDNLVALDKRTKTYWTITTGTFTLGTGGETISLIATAANIGSVDSLLSLRLTDSSTTTAYGTTLMPASNTGTTAVPVTGKNGLKMTDLNKSLYISSNGTTAFNPLINITFTWIGTGGNTNWANAGNWTGAYAVGYPSASTEIAIINTTSGTQPTINSGTSIELYQLTVGSGMTLTMTGSSSIKVYDLVSFTGTAAFDSSSTFGYASSNAVQNILNLPYGSLSLTGTSGKNWPATVTVTGNYTVSGYAPAIGTNTFIYAGHGTQRIAPGKYYNLVIANDRNGGLITLGTPPAPGTVDIANNFDVSTLSNYTYPGTTPILSYTTVNFSAAGTQYIPGFHYPKDITCLTSGARILDSLGSTDINHVIYCRAFNRGTVSSYTVKGSKVTYYVTGIANIPWNFTTYNFNDLEMTGNMNGFAITFNDGPFYIGGKFNCSLTNYKQLTGSTASFVFNGSVDQTIPSFTTNVATNTPAFRYPNVVIQGLGRNVTLAPTDTIGIMGSFQVPGYTSITVPMTYSVWNYVTQPFSTGKGFITTGSTVNFSVGSAPVPVLRLSSSGGYNYNNLVVTSGTRILDSSMTIGGNLAVAGADTSLGVLNIGNGNNPRVLNVLGNIDIRSSGTGLRQMDMNTGTLGTATINLKGNLTISGNGQLMGTTTHNAKNGIILFNGTTTQTYSNTSTTYKNGFVNFIVGDGVTASTLKLASSMNLLASAGATNRDTLTVAINSGLDCSTNNIISNGPAASYANFNLQSGATLTTANTGGVEGAATNSANGSIVNDASLVKTYSPLANYLFNPATAGNTGFPAVTTPFPMANLTIGDNTSDVAVSLNKSIEVSNSVTIDTLNTLGVSNSYLNLKSTATATARLAPVPGNANITYGTGRFIVERYYPARRAWRMVTAPVTGETSRSFYNAWQMGGGNVGGSGTFITGPGANPATNGLDVSPLNNFSLKTYDAVLGNWVGVSNTKTLLLSGTTGTAGIPDNIGLFMFIRGDRSTGSLYNTSFSNITTLRDTGKVQIHSQTFKLNAPNNGFDVVGNPFASPVDITKVMASSTNIDTSFFYVYDPYINSEQGAYVTMTLSGGVWKPTPDDGTITQDKNIMSSQAFFVRKTSNSQGTIVFNETNKSSGSNAQAFRPLSQQPTLFATNLYLKNDSSRTIADGTLIAFDEAFSSAVGNDDAPKFGNPKENLSMIRATKALTVERRQPITAADTIFFKLTKTTQRKYQFEFKPTGMDPLLTAFLEDSYTGIKTSLSVTDISDFEFSVNGDAKSAAADRFRIVFKASAGPLPVTYSDIKAYQKAAAIAVEWTVENEVNISKYEVEKSTDGSNFTRINTTGAKGASGAITYAFLDTKPAEGNNFYRIVSYSQTGKQEYSRVVVVKTGKTGNGISIYPNPVKGNMIGVAFNNMEKGVYDLRLINTLGQVLMTRQITHAAGSSTETLTAGSQLSAGIYQLEITSPDKSASTVKVIVE